MQQSDDESVMYLIVNSDLPMAKGKTASQCCHAACAVTRILERCQTKDPAYLKWVRDGETKIVLRATEKQLLELIAEYEVDSVVKRESSGIWCTAINDAGRTQIPSGSLTAVAFRPVLRSKMNPVVQKLKLL